MKESIGAPSIKDDMKKSTANYSILGVNDGNKSELSDKRMRTGSFF
jgi:hypothetical protein